MTMNVDYEKDRSLFIDFFQILLDVEGLGVQIFIRVSPIPIEVVPFHICPIIAVQHSFAVDHWYEMEYVAFF